MTFGCEFVQLPVSITHACTCPLHGGGEKEVREELVQAKMVIFRKYLSL